MIVDIFLKIAQNIPLSQSEMEELSAYISASHTTTAKITNMREISELGYDLGEVWAGRFIASANPNNNDVASSTFTGTYMDAAGVTGKNAGTTQFSLSSADGKATAGGGIVYLDENGIGITEGTSITLANKIKFVDTGGAEQTYLAGYNNSGNNGFSVSVLPITGKASSIDITMNSPSGKYSRFDIYANGDGGLSGKNVQFTLDSSSVLAVIRGGLVINEDGVDCDTRIEGDTDTNLFVADAGLDAIGIGGAAESGKKLKVTGDVHITGAATLDGNVTLGDAAADTLTFNGTPAGQIVGGTYTPTLSNTTNVAASTARVCQYMRVGSVVTVSGSVNIDPTATGSTVLTMSLPIASNFANTYELGGSGAPDITTPIPVVIRGSSTADAAIFVFNATSTSAQEVYFTFTYRII